MSVTNASNLVCMSWKVLGFDYDLEPETRGYGYRYVHRNRPDASEEVVSAMEKDLHYHVSSAGSRYDNDLVKLANLGSAGVVSKKPASDAYHDRERSSFEIDPHLIKEALAADIPHLGLSEKLRLAREDPVTLVLAAREAYSLKDGPAYGKLPYEELTDKFDNGMLWNVKLDKEDSVGTYEKIVNVPEKVVHYGYVDSPHSSEFDLAHAFDIPGKKNVNTKAVLPREPTYTIRRNSHQPRDVFIENVKLPSGAMKERKSVYLGAEPESSRKFIPSRDNVFLRKIDLDHLGFTTK